MKPPKLGNDPTDFLSEPTSVIKTKLTQIFEIPIRRSAEKPGRELTVTWDERKPLIKDFSNRYSYVVNFTKRGNLAGNHYHHHKQELFTPLVGEAKIILENVDSKIREELQLHPGQVVYIPANTAHVVISESEVMLLYVSATYPNNEQDEFPYAL